MCCMSKNRSSSYIVMLILLCIITLCMCGCSGKNSEQTENKNKQADNKKSDEKEDALVLPDDEAGSELLLYTDALNGDSDEDNAGAIKEVVEVKRGDYSHSMNSLGKIVYLDEYYEVVPIADSRFKKYKVEVGDKVKKGDTIYTYEIDMDDAMLEQMEAEVVQREKDYSAGYNQRKAEINQAEYELKGLTDKNEIQIKKQEIKKLKLALKEFEGSKEDIDKSRQALDELLKGSGSTRLTASHDGYIQYIEEYQEGDMLYKGNVAAIISPRKDYYVEVEDISKGKLRFNSEVTIHVEGDNGEKEKTMKGKVISSSNILSPANMKDVAYVKIIDEPKGVNWDNNIKISYTSKEMKDVLILPKNAVQYETIDQGSEVASAAYVYIYEDEHAYKRYIEVYDSGGDNLVVLQGLTQGQQVAVYQ